MSETARIVVGDCTAEYEGGTVRTQRGHVVVVVKPDDTVLVHDLDGYQPVAWLTRPAALTDDPGAITARDGNQGLHVTVHDAVLDERYPVSPAGTPVGTCPDCTGPLVRASGTVACVGCADRFGLPGGATVTDRTCTECDRPLVSVERGAVFEVCVDRHCDALDDRVRDRFDRSWSCPDCGGDLRILRRGGLIAGCADYPDCETGFAVPRGVVSGECGCGLPTFEMDGMERCLDAACGVA